MRQLKLRHCLLCWIVIASCSAAADPPRLGGPTTAADSVHPDHTMVIANIATGLQVSDAQHALQRAYEALNITLKFVNMPAGRALLESNAGNVDGELARIASIESAYPNLRRVNAVLFFNENAAFVQKGEAPAPEDLKALAMLSSVGVLNGYKITEDVTRNWPNIVRINTYSSAVKMLAAGRIAAFFGRAEDVQTAMEQLGLKANDFDSRQLLRVPLYHYLNKKHESLIPALTMELRRLQGRHESVLDSARAGAR